MLASLEDQVGKVSVAFIGPSLGCRHSDPFDLRIANDGGNKDIFLHISAVEQADLAGPSDDQKGTFDIEAVRDSRESVTNIQLV